MPVILSLRKLRQEDQELGANLGYLERPCHKKKKYINFFVLQSEKNEWNICK